MGVPHSPSEGASNLLPRLMPRPKWKVGVAVSGTWPESGLQSMPVMVSVPSKSSDESLCMIRVRDGSWVFTVPIC
jgi:hypothetical protein